MVRINDFPDPGAMNHCTKEQLAELRPEFDQIYEEAVRMDAEETDKPTTVMPLGPILDSDMANGKRVVAEHGNFIRFTDEAGFYIWNRKQWMRDPKNTRMHTIVKRRHENIFDEIKHADNQTALFKWARQSQHAIRVRAAIDMIRSEPGILASVNDFDSDRMVINTQSGLVDLNTGVVVPASPSHMCARIAGARISAEHGCERWERFLLEIMGGDAEMVGYLRRAIGYSLTGRTDEQCLFFCYGFGANGKSVLIEILNALVGSYATTARIETFTIDRNRSSSIPNDVAALAGARVVSVAETDEGQRLSESLVKDLTGGDTISARFLHQEFFKFTPQFKLWIRGNHKPDIRGTDDGIWRRIQLIPFAVQFKPEDRDPNLLTSLMLELPGILEWAVRGCLEWQANGLRPPKKIVKAVAEYRTEMDVLGQFLADCATMRADSRVRAKDFYGAYKDWAEDSGHGVVSVKRFGLAMQERGFRKKKERAGAYYLDVDLIA